MAPGMLFLRKVWLFFTK